LVAGRDRPKNVPFRDAAVIFLFLATLKVVPDQSGCCGDDGEDGMANGEELVMLAVGQETAHIGEIAHIGGRQEAPRLQHAALHPVSAKKARILLP